MAQKQATRQSQNQAITLKGSTAIVTEFFEYSVNRYVMCSHHSGSDRVLRDVASGSSGMNGR